MFSEEDGYVVFQVCSPSRHASMPQLTSSNCAPISPWNTAFSLPQPLLLMNWVSDKSIEHSHLATMAPLINEFGNSSLIAL